MAAFCVLNGAGQSGSNVSPRLTLTALTGRVLALAWPGEALSYDLEQACSMCMTRARAGADGNIYLAFRSAVGNIRDFYVLKGAAAENQFTAVRVNQDDWNIDYCPMCGPELNFDPYGRALCAFMTSNRVYWAVSDKPLTRFNLHVSTPANENNEIFPTVIANRRGEGLFLW